MHERQAIREAVVAALLNKTAAGPRVFKSRQEPVRGTELPAINVYSDGDLTDEASVSSAPREFTRRYALQIVGWVAASTPTPGPAPLVDDKLDDLSREIEAALDADVTLGETAANSFIAEFEFGERIEGERPMGAIIVNLVVEYRVGLRIDAPTARFNTADIRTSIDGEQALDDQLHDHVTNLNPGP